MRLFGRARQLTNGLAVVSFGVMSFGPAMAQGAWADFDPHQGVVAYSAGAAGDQMHVSRDTRRQARQDFTPDINTDVAARAERGSTFTTGKGALTRGDQMGAILPRTRTTQYGGPGGRRIGHLDELPPTRLSSFVADSGNADAIYGDEGAYIENFEADNTIGSGLDNADPDHDLSTGHASELPSAWLNDIVESVPVAAIAPAAEAEVSVDVSVAF